MNECIKLVCLLKRLFQQLVNLLVSTYLPIDYTYLPPDLCLFLFRWSF